MCLILTTLVHIGICGGKFKIVLTYFAFYPFAVLLDSHCEGSWAVGINS